MITEREIYDLVQDLKGGGFYCEFVNGKLQVLFKRKLIMTIDFEKRTIEFGERPIKPNEHPRFSYFMGRIWGVLWGKEEKKYRLKMPAPFGSAFHQVYVNLVGDRYIISTNENTESYKSVFTQNEIDTMPFDTKFFVKEEVK